RGDAPAAPPVQRAHEAALVLALRGGLQPPPAVRDRGAPSTFDADFGVVGARGPQRVEQTVLHSESSRSFSAQSGRITISPPTITSRSQGRMMKFSLSRA